MQFKIDENLPLEIKELLAQHKHDPLTVVEEGLSGSLDPDVARVCQKEARAILTLDLDFSDIRTYPPEHYHGIVVFRPATQSISALVRLTTRLLTLLEREPLEGYLWIVEDGQVRIREGSQGETRVT